MLKNSSVIIMILFLASCTFTTNVGDYLQSKVETSVRSEEVRVYGASEVYRYDSQFLGQVETQYCQDKKLASLPPKSNLQRILRAKAHVLGGNGIVYGQCRTSDFYNGCHKHISCDGSVYRVTF